MGVVPQSTRPSDDLVVPETSSCHSTKTGSSKIYRQWVRKQTSLYQLTAHTHATTSRLVGRFGVPSGVTNFQLTKDNLVWKRLLLTNTSCALMSTIGEGGVTASCTIIDTPASLLAGLHSHISHFMYLIAFLWQDQLSCGFFCYCAKAVAPLCSQLAYTHSRTFRAFPIVCREDSAEATNLPKEMGRGPWRRYTLH